MFNTRRKTVLILTLLSIFFTFVAASSGYWIHWTVLAISFFMWLLADLMFFDDAAFLYEPDFRAYQDKVSRD